MSNKLSVAYITHTILSYNPFTVEFTNFKLGRTKVEKYAVVLTKKEIEAEYDYIDFPEFPVNTNTELEDLKNECELNALENQSPEC